MKIESIRRPFGNNNEGHRHNHRNGDRSFYQSKAWRTTRNAFIAANPWCIECAKEGKKVAATVADHIEQVIINEEKKLDWKNLRPLCSSHHNQCSARQKNQMYKGK